jgi:hypothetical protein
MGVKKTYLVPGNVGWAKYTEDRSELSRLGKLGAAKRALNRKTKKLAEKRECEIVELEMFNRAREENAHLVPIDPEFPDSRFSQDFL